MYANICCAGGLVTVNISYIPDMAEPVCVTVDNASGTDARIRVVREPGTDTNFRVFGVEGEKISSTKTYSLAEGVNVVKVFQGNRLLEARTFQI